LRGRSGTRETVMRLQALPSTWTPRTSREWGIYHPRLAGAPPAGLATQCVET